MDAPPTVATGDVKQDPRWVVWVYKGVCAFQIWILGMVVCADIAIIMVDGEGMEELGAAIWGFLIGAILGLIAAIAFLWAPVPRRGALKFLVVALLFGAWMTGLGIMEILDNV